MLLFFLLDFVVLRNVCGPGNLWGKVQILLMAFSLKNRIRRAIAFLVSLLRRVMGEKLWALGTIRLRDETDVTEFCRNTEDPRSPRGFFFFFTLVA